MQTLFRRAGFALLLMIAQVTTVTAQQKMVITKCQDCSNKASKWFQTCMAGGKGAGCQAPFQKRMTHCNKKFCNQKTKKITIG